MTSQFHPFHPSRNSWARAEAARLSLRTYTPSLQIRFLILRSTESTRARVCLVPTHLYEAENLLSSVGRFPPTPQSFEVTSTSCDPTYQAVYGRNGNIRGGDQRSPKPFAVYAHSPLLLSLGICLTLVRFSPAFLPLAMERTASVWWGGADNMCV